MAVEVLIPRLGFAVTEGRIAEWLVPNGKSVTEGEPIFTLESDKSVQEIEAPASGVLQILVEAGEAYPVGSVVAEIR